MTSVVTRFPPSPTGFLHIGRMRTALFNYLFTKKEGGKMVFRIEDTDKERSKKEFEEDIIESLKWLGIAWDEGPYRQSERNENYVAHLKRLLEEGKAYEGEASEKGEGKVIRLKNPNTPISFDDIIRGPITFDTTELGDIVIARSLEDPLYHFTVVVDDFEMGVTHVIRGDDHISNTPRQILIAQALGASRPAYAHIPLILAPDRSKMSGRHGAVSVREYKKLGYLPEALINYLALLGWHPEDDAEILSMSELIARFDLARVQKGGAIFNIEKLNWLNKEYLKKLHTGEHFANLRPFVPEKVSDALLEKLLPVLMDRVSYYGEAKDLFEAGEFDYLLAEPQIDPRTLPWKSDAPAITREYLTEVLRHIELVEPDRFDAETIKEALWGFADEKGKGNVLWPTRYALTGKEKSADPFTVAGLLGKETTTKRLKAAIALLG